MAKTPLTAAALEAYLRELFFFSEADGLAHVVPILSHDVHNAPVASVEVHHKGRCLRIEAINIRVVRCVAWEQGQPAGPDGQRAWRRSYVGGHGRGKAGADVDGVRGWVSWLNGGEEP